MIAKCPCQKCGNPIEFEAEHADERIECPHCRQQTFLTIMRLTKRIEPPLAKSIQNPVKEHLKKIRSASNYPTLRFLIEICVGFSLIGVLIFVCGIWLPFIEIDKSARLSEALAWTMTFAAMLVAAIFIAFREVAFLFVDIADTLLNEHSKSK